jgi:hypothetical protein
MADLPANAKIKRNISADALGDKSAIAEFA